MKKTALVTMLLCSALAAGCGTMGGSASKSGDSKTAGQVVDDAVIVTRVKAAYAADPDVSALKINVDSEKGRVTLKGEVKSMVIWKKAEALARGVAGVQSVNNQLVITG